MFRDRDKALEALQQELLQEDPQEDMPAASEDALPDPQEVDAYNADTSDTDLEAFSEAVYTPRRKNSWVLWFVLLTAAVLLFLAYILAKWEGLL